MQIKERSGLRNARRTPEFRKIMSDAVAETIRENKAIGVANVFSRDGQLYYELPSGEITCESPFKERLQYKP